MTPRRRLLLAILVSILALLFGPNLIQGNQVLKAFQGAAVWPRPGGIIDVSQELSEVLRLGDREDTILSDVRFAGFSVVSDGDGNVEGLGDHPPLDRFVEFRRAEHWWNILFVDEYRLMLGIKDHRLAWLAAYVTVGGLGTI